MIASQKKESSSSNNGGCAEKNSYQTKPGYLKAIMRAVGLPDDNLYLLQDGCILKFPYDSRFDADFPKMKFRKGVIIVVNCPFEDDCLWFLYCWRLLVIRGHSSLLIMRSSKYKSMLKLLPEAEYLLRNTPG